MATKTITNKRGGFFSKEKHRGMSTVKDNSVLTGRQQIKLEKIRGKNAHAKAVEVGKSLRSGFRNVATIASAHMASKNATSAAANYSSLINSGVTSQNPASDNSSNTTGEGGLNYLE